MNNNKNGYGSKYTNTTATNATALKRGGNFSTTQFNDSHQPFPHPQHRSQNSYQRKGRTTQAGITTTPPSPGQGISGQPPYNAREFDNRHDSHSRAPDGAANTRGGGTSHPLDPYLDRFRNVAEVLSVARLHTLKVNAGQPGLALVAAANEFEHECAVPARTLLIKIVKTDLEYFQVHRCERVYWKFLCYALLNGLEQEPNGPTNDDAKDGAGKRNRRDGVDRIIISECVTGIIAQNDRFYQALTDVLRHTYGFDCDLDGSQVRHNLADTRSAQNSYAQHHGPPTLNGQDTSLAERDGGSMRPSKIARPTARTQKLCLFLAHWIAVARGDLARYAGSGAAQWYDRAIKLYPKMGHAYNQMGVVSVGARKPLDALYYFTRGLAAPFPSETAHHSLQALFEDIRRRSIAFRHHAKLSQPEQQQQQQRSSKTPDKYLGDLSRTNQTGDDRSGQLKAQILLERLLTKKKTEVWVRVGDDGNDLILTQGPTHTHTNRSIPADAAFSSLMSSLGMGGNTGAVNDRELDSNTVGAYDTLKRCFVLNYIHCHAKLYTRTDLETFDVIAHDALVQFRALLDYSYSDLDRRQMNGATSHTPPVHFLTGLRLVQIFAINMFAVERCQAAARSLRCLDSSHRPLVLGAALQFALEMFVAVAESYASASGSRTATVDKQLLPCLSIWCDWMLGNASVWNPMPGPILADKTDFGGSVARFANTIVANAGAHERDNSTRELLDQWKRGKGRGGGLLLMEDGMLRGFVPLMATPQRTGDCNDTVNSTTSESCGSLTRKATITTPSSLTDAERADLEAAIRTDKITPFGDVLMGLDPPVLDYDKGTKKYFSLINVPQTPAEDDEIPTENLDELYTHEQMDSLVELHETTLGSLEKLRLKNTHLPELQAKMEDFRQKLKMTHSKHTIIEIRPRYLVCDTNCLIDHLIALEAIIKWNNSQRKSQSHNGYSPSGFMPNQRYTILIPLVVVSELEKLSVEQSSPASYNTNQNPQYRSFQKHRADCARAALRFIDRNLPVKNVLPGHKPHLSILTGRGNVLDSLNYRTELSSDSSGDERDTTRGHNDEGASKSGARRADKAFHKGGAKDNRGYSTRNDDTILRGCLKLIDKSTITTRSNEPTETGGSDKNAPNIDKILAGAGAGNRRSNTELVAAATVRVKRDLVFFTDDQNLKIKAHTLMVPTCSVGNFMKWAALPF